MTEEERAEWRKLVKIGVQCNLKQLLDEGFFHADPHSGNLLRTSDGKLAYLDFGMMSALPKQRRSSLSLKTRARCYLQGYLDLGLGFWALNRFPKPEAIDCKPQTPDARGLATLVVIGGSINP